MEQNLLNILNPDKAVRTQAMDCIESTCEQNPQNTFQQLNALIFNERSQNQSLELALMVLHKNLLSKHQRYEKLDKSETENLMNNLMQMLSMKSDHFSMSFTKRSAEICVEIAVKTQQKLSFANKLTQLWSSDQSKLKLNKFVIYSIELLCEFTENMEELSTVTPSLLNIIQSGLVSTDPDLKTSSAMALTTLLNNTKDTTVLASYSSVVQNLIEIMVEMIKNQDESQGLKMIRSFDELASFQPKFLLPFVENIVFVFTEMFASEEVPMPVRIAAMNFFITFSEKNGMALKKSQNFTEKTLITFFKVLMTNIEDEMTKGDKINKELTKEALSESNIEGVITNVLPSLSDTLGAKFMFSKFAPMIIEALGSNDWKAQYSGLLVVGLLCENTKQHFKGDLPNLMKMILPYLNSPNQKVVYGALTALGMLSIEYNPDLQKTYYKELIPQLLKLMDCSGTINSRINTRATSCLISFSRELILVQEDQEDEEEVNYNFIFEEYINAMSEAIANLFGKGVNDSNIILLEEVLGLISVLSHLLKSAFIPYYRKFMDGIKQLISKLNSDQLTAQQTNLKCLLVDTAGFLITGCADDLSTIKEDLNEIVSFLQSLIQSANEEDPILKSALSFYGIVCEKLKNNFAPLLSNVLEFTLKCARKAVKIHFDEAETFTDKGQNFQSMQFDMKIFGGKKMLSINHAVLELKLTAFQTLAILVKNFRNQFDDKVKETVFSLIKSHFESMQSTSVKKLSLKILRNLLKDTTEKTFNLLMDDLSRFIISDLEKLVPKEEQEDLVYYMNKLYKIYADNTKRKLRGLNFDLTSPKSIKPMTEFCVKVLQRSSQLRKEIVERYQGYDLQDPDVKEDIEYDCEGIAELDRCVMQLSGEFVKYSNDSDVQSLIISNLAPYYLNVLENPSCNTQYMYGLCFFADLMEFGPTNFFTGFKQQALNFALNTLTMPNQPLETLQTAVYLLGVIYMTDRSGNPDPQLQNVILKMNELANRTDAYLDEDNSLYTDNCVATLFKIFLIHWKVAFSSEEQANMVLQNVLSKMPLKGDKEESVVINRYIVLELNNNNPWLVGNEVRKGLVLTYLQNLKQTMNNDDVKELVDETVRNFLTNL